MNENYMIGPEDEGYFDIKPWKFWIDGYSITWRPDAPYLFGESDEASLVVNQIFKFVQYTKASSGDVISPAVTGIRVPVDVSSPYMVFYAVNLIYDEDDGLEFSDNAPTFLPKTDPAYGDDQVIN